MTERNDGRAVGPDMGRDPRGVIQGTVVPVWDVGIHMEAMRALPGTDVSVIFAGTNEGRELHLNKSEAFVSVAHETLRELGDLAPYWERVDELRELQEKSGNQTA